jgi:hypothetical protein
MTNSANDVGNSPLSFIATNSCISSTEMGTGEAPGSSNGSRYTNRLKMSILNTTAFPSLSFTFALGLGKSFTASTY